MTSQCSWLYRINILQHMGERGGSGSWREHNLFPRFRRCTNDKWLPYFQDFQMTRTLIFEYFFSWIRIPYWKVATPDTTTCIFFVWHFFPLIKRQGIKKEKEKKVPSNKYPWGKKLVRCLSLYRNLILLGLLRAMQIYSTTKCPR